MNRQKHLEALLDLIYRKPFKPDPTRANEISLLYSANSGRSLRKVKEYLKILVIQGKIQITPNNWYLNPIIEKAERKH